MVPSMVMNEQKAATIIQANFRGFASRKEGEKKRVKRLSLYQKQHDPRFLAAKARSLQAISAFAFLQYPIEDGMKVVVITYLVLKGRCAYHTYALDP
jgi:hypothetical protein